MAPNDPWPPMASPSNSKGPGKGRGGNGNKKTTIKDNQQQILVNLKEMFQSIVDDDVILSVASSCDWQHQACIDALINISENIDIENNKNNDKKYDDVPSDLLKITKNVYKQQEKEFKKFEKIKKNSRMGSFRGSIPKLESLNSDVNVNNLRTLKLDNEKTWEHNNPPSSPSVQTAWRRDNYQGQSLKKPNKNESSLCGLKVHYRTLGTDTSSDDDDDADVVIEEEVNTINIPTSIHVNSSQFLSSAVSPAQKITVHHETIDKIKSSITRGENILILIRGLPGSGKTTLSKSIIESTIGGDSSKYIFSADDFFINDKTGDYDYNPNKIPEAHLKTQKKVLESIKAEVTPIIIDNTNLQAWEMRPYAAIAVKHGYIVETLDTDTPWSQNVNELFRKNKHNVPKDRIRIMMNRYERGLTGQKLCDYFNLKYPDDNIPNIKKSLPVINDIDVLSSEDITALENLSDSIVQDELKNQYFDYLKELRDRKESQSSIEDGEKKMDESLLEDYHLVLGAIGSERKNSLVPQDITTTNIEDDLIASDDNNENSLGQCWDFTLLMDGETIHSCRNNQKSPVCPSVIQKQDKEFSKINEKINKETPSSLLKVLDNDNNKSMQHAVNVFLKELADGYNKTQRLDKISLISKDSSVVITEIHEQIDDESALAEDKTDEILNTDIKIENILPNDDELVEVLSEDDKNSSENTCEEKDSSFLQDAEEAILEVDCAEEATEQSTIGSLLTLLKTSILRRGNEAQSDDNNIEQINSKNNQLVDGTSDIQNTPDSTIINVPIAEIRAAMDSTDNDVEKIEIKTEDPDVYSLECVELKDDHFLSSELKSSSSDDSDNLAAQPSNKNLFIKTDNEKSDIIDNFNRITWKESPFPVDDIPILSPKIEENEVKNVVKVDAETNTTYYDFNVAYVGGTSEPGYRVLDAFSRQINDSSSSSKQPERLPVKLMLDKSSMIGGFYPRQENSNDLEDDEEKKDRLPELIELFPHIPREYLHEMYEKVDKNFDWVVELLLDGVPEYGILETSEKISTLPRSDSTETLEDEAVGGNFDETEEKEEKLTENEEKQMEASSSSVSPDMLMDIKSRSDSDSTATATTTASPVSEVFTKDDLSIEQEEIMELNLGFDFIQQLEKKFGNEDFHQTDGFLPVVKITKSMGEALYALWIESMCQQLNARQALLDQMISKDADFARDLEREQYLENTDKNIPNLKEIMDMEMALASVENERKSLSTRETNDDMILRLSTQILHDSHPDIDANTFCAILDAHNGDYYEAFKAIELNTGKKILPCYVKKQKNLMERVKKETNLSSNWQEIKPDIIFKDIKTDKQVTSYKTALTAERNSRQHAERQLSLRLQNINKAQEMYHKGLPEVAAYYSNLATLHMKNTETAPFCPTEDSLDLHYLTVADALHAVDEFIEYHVDRLIKSDKRSKVLTIITGWGSRSHGTGRIKPAVMKQLTKRGIKFTEDNPGALKVTLRRKNSIVE